MAGFRKIYTSQNEYLYDVGKSTGLFDDEYFELAKESGKDLEYLQMMASAKNNISNTFNSGIYWALSGEERFNYFATENFMDKSSQEYKDSQTYFNQRIQQIKNEEIYNSLNNFEKTMSSIGGWFANMTLQLGGLVEGLVDVSGLAAGAVGGIFDADFAERMKNFVAEDATGYNAAQQSMNDWINKYTFLDKNIVAKGINDITTGIVRMTPMIVGSILAPLTGGISTTVGTSIYYASMGGNAAEEAIKANPDINYGALLGYTAGTVGLEALTEWASAKLFGGDTISKLAFGGNAVKSSNILRSMLHDFGTEALEEATSELFGSMLYKALVDPTANIASIEDILYAAIIGGLTGVVMFGGDVVFGTKRLSVLDGKLVETKTLTPEQRKTATKLGLGKSYTLQNALAKAQTLSEKATNVTKLMTKYGTSLQDIQQNHAEEYKKAVEQDTQIKKNQADGILALANLMQTIGVEQFTKSAKFLEENLAEAEQAIYNFNNHTDVNNKKASEAFKTLYPNETFTPVAIPTKAEQTLATELRKILPGTMVSFGVFGNPEGLAKASINQGGNFIFIKSGLVEQMGFDAALNEVIKYEIAQDVMRQLPVDEMKKLIKYATEDDVEYDKLSHDQKLTIAQMICFDPVFNQKTFLGDKKTHLQIYNYLNKEIKKTGLPKVKFNNLLKIRNTFLNSIANFVANQEDLDAIQKKYNLSDEELQEKIVRFTTITNFNNRMRLADLDLAKQSISKCYAQKELESHLKTEGEFDWNRLYDKTYYDDDYVEQIMGDNPDFKEALIIHLSDVYNADFNAIALASMEKYVKENMSKQEVRKVANEILTEDFVKNTTNLSELQTEVANKMWWLTQLDIAKIDLDADSIIVTNDQIKGTGKLKYLKVKVDERNNIYNDQQQRGLGESAREQVGNVVTKPTTIANKVTINQIDERSYNERQKEMTVYTEKEYGVNLHFYEGSAILEGYDTNTDYGLNGFIYGDDDIYIRYDDTLSESVIERVLLHEGTHKLISDNEYAYKRLLNELIPIVKNFDTLLSEYKSNDMYGLIYENESDIIEEVIVDICCGRITNVEWATNAYDGIQKIFDFYRDVSHVMYNIEQSFFDKNKTLSQQNVREKMRPHVMSNETATWTKERLDKLIDRNTSSDNPNRVEAYAAYINPHDFVAATTSTARERGTIRMQMRDYDYLGNLADISETPYLRINPSTMEIVGHEGRHRMWAMSDAGITEAAVVIYFDKTDDATLSFQNNIDAANRIYEFVTFKGQTDYNGFGGKENQAFVTFRDMIPLNESHRTDLEKTFVKGFEFGEGPKIRFAKDLKQQTSNETKNIKSAAKAQTGKEIANAIVDIVKTMPMKLSEAQGFEKPYMYRSLENIRGTLDDNTSLFNKINEKNWHDLYGTLYNSTDPDTRQALILLKAYLRIDDQNNINSVGYMPLDDKSRFSEDTRNEILSLLQAEASLNGQQLSAISKTLSDKTSFSELKQRFEKDGYSVSVSDEMVQRYVPETKDKKSFEKEIDEQINDISDKIENGDNLDKAELNQELRKLLDKKYVVLNESNEKIIDWALSNEDVPTVASKIQQDVFKQFVATAELAEKTEGKKALTILVDDKTGLPKPFPKATQWIEKNVKRLKSFRMWAMLTSPVSWVRNWVGNAGMTALDSATNQLEKWMTARLPQIDVAKLEQQAKELNSKKTLTDAEKTKLAEINAQIQQAYDFKFVETTASKELKQQIAQEYKSVFQQILNGEDISKYEGSAEKAGAIARAEREITRKSENASFIQKVWAACQSVTDWGLNTGLFGDNAVVLNSLIKNFANMVESNKTYLIKSLTTEYGKDGRGMSAERKALVEKALNTKNSMDIVNAMSKSDVELFMDSCKQRTFEQYFKNSNWLSKWASNLSQKHPILASLTSLVLPFPKVAANIMTMAYKYSPLGFISALRQWSVVKQMDAAGYKGVRDAFARAKLTRTTAQATVGTVMCIAGLILASLGFVDIDDDDYLGPALHMGDLRISLSNLAPSMTTFSVGAAMMWAWKNDQSAALKALDVLYDNTLLGNIENVFRYGDPTKYIENLSINYVSQYVPAMLKLFAKFTTNQAMIDKSGSYFEKLGKTFVSGIPFAANLLPKKINPYTGEFLTNTGSQNVFFNFMEAISPLDFKTTTKSKTQKEAERLGTESSGLTGKFKINDKEYDIDKVTYSKYRATYIQNTFDNIINGKQKVTVEDENGKRITTTYDKLTDKQKKNVLSRLYTEATNITKIKWWTDQGNKYVVTDRELYNEYRKQFKNIIYKKTWTKSKFVES